ncbi:hypothetical protein [Anatilimnocola floriformis]|uniref:hypothetical protein n=1 Tax=Anatilimnocola floriformis TaxID=2948575 RepID=UPI0020C4D712|nr:hypothetical protein [Anatilimnocola floriformis]
MSIVACPRCRDEVMLPGNLSPQARVRCPLCRDEYTLSEALAKMPPMLIVVDAGPKPAHSPAYSQSEAGAFAQPEAIDYAESDYQVSSDLTAGGAAFDSSGAVGESPASVSPKKYKAKPKKKEAGPIAMLIQVVLGGVCAGVLFHLICWWTPLLGYTDPLGAAPTVKKYMPFIVPAKVMENSYGIKADGSAVAQNDPAPKPEPKPKPKPEDKKQGEFFIPEPKFDPKVEPMLDPLDPGKAPAIPPEPEDPAMDPKGIDFKIPGPKNFDPPMPPKPADPPMPPAPAPKASSAQVTTAYAEAVSKLQDFEGSAGEAGPVRQQKGKDLYEAASNLGKLCADADMAEGENADKVMLIKDELTGKLRKYSAMLAMLGDQRLADGATEDSIAISGVIKDIKPLGGTHETTIEVTRPKDKTLFTVAVVTTKSLEDDGAKVGDTAIVLGKIVRDPKKDLPAYKGEAPVVVHAGHVTLQ